MWNDFEDGKFVEAGTHCVDHSSEGCEVTLFFTEITPIKEFKTRLFVCGDELTKQCKYFEGLLLGGFKEQNSKEANIPDVSRSEMLFFLQHAMVPDRSLPLGKDSICTLIKSSDQFLCAALQKRLADHLNTESFFLDAPAETKLELLEVADQHRCCTWDILETCIRLCSNLTSEAWSSLNAAYYPVSKGTKAAVEAISLKLAARIKDIPRVIHRPRECRKCVRERIKKGEYRSMLDTEVERMRDSAAVETFHLSGAIIRAAEAQKIKTCPICGSEDKFKNLSNLITYEQIKKFTIDRNLLRE